MYGQFDSTTERVSFLKLSILDSSHSLSDGAYCEALYTFTKCNALNIVSSVVLNPLSLSIVRVVEIVESRYPFSRKSLFQIKIGSTLKRERVTFFESKWNIDIYSSILIVLLVYHAHKIVCVL